MALRLRPALIGAAAVTALVMSPMAALAGPDDGSDSSGGGTKADPIVLDLYTLTDVHGHIEQREKTDRETGEKYIAEAGLASVGCYLDKARQENPNSSFTLLGDNIGASPWVSGSQDDNPTIAALNLLNPVASTLGNHELDWGQQVFKDRIDGANGYTKVEFPYLAANVEGLGDYLGDYVVWESPSGIKVAFIGAIAQDVPYKLSPGYTEGLTFNDPAPILNDTAGQLKADGVADVVIAMLDDDVKNNLPLMGSNIDGLMGGDTHLPYAFSMADGADGHKLSGVASGSYTDNLGMLRLSIDPDTKHVVNSEAILTPAKEIATCDPPQADVAAVVDEAVANAEAEGAKVVAQGITYPFYRGVVNIKGEDQAGGNRGIESTLGDLIADAMRAQIHTPDGEMVDIGVINAGGIRTDLLPNDAGEVTKAQVFEILPFSNYVGYVEVTGAQFKQALEQQWKTGLNSQNSRPMLKLGLSENVTYVYDWTKPLGERVTSITINGKEMDPAATYTVGSVNFLLTGGDGFEALDTGLHLVDGLDRDIFAQYLADNAGVTPRFHKASFGLVMPEGVATEGDITFAARGLSFSENVTRAINFTVRLYSNDYLDGEMFMNFDSETVDNSLVDPNYNTEEGIVTTDGVGQAVVKVPVKDLCEATGYPKGDIGFGFEALTTYEVFYSMTGIPDEPSVFINCEALAPADDETPAPDKKDPAPDDTPADPDKKPGDGDLANTGAAGIDSVLAAFAALMIAGSVAIIRRKRLT